MVGGFRQYACTCGGAAVGVSHDEGEPADDPAFAAEALADPVGESQDGSVILHRIEAVPFQHEVGDQTRCRFRRDDRARAEVDNERNGHRPNQAEQLRRSPLRRSSLRRGAATQDGADGQRFTADRHLP